MSEVSLVRDKRTLLRSINGLKSSLIDLSKVNPSLDNVHKAGASIKSIEDELKQLKEIDRQLLTLIDYDKCSTSKQLEKEESRITKDHNKLRHEISNLKGQFRSMKAQLDEQARANQSILNETENPSFQQSERSNSAAKLPKINVPKFNGEISTYTEWHAQFEAMIHWNDSLKTQEKKFFLENAMVGKAATVLHDYPIAGDLYEDAYAHVKRRYFNRRKIIENHFRILFELPSINSSNLRESLDRVNATIRGLNSCKIDVKKMSPIIAYSLVRKLPDQIRQDWENSQSDYSMYPSYDTLDNWLNMRCFVIESSTSVEPQNKANYSPISPTTTPKLKVSAEPKPKSSLPVTNASKMVPASPKFATFSSPKCYGCGESHYLSQCPQFLSKSIPDKELYITQKRLCRNCLRQGHNVTQCNSSKCRKCGNNHHTTLHAELTTTSSHPGSSIDTKSSLAVIQSNMHLLLPTAVVKVQIGSRYVFACALIDSGSQVELVTESFVKRHRLEKLPSSTSIRGITSSNLHLNYSVSLLVESRYNDTQIRIDAEVIGGLPYNVVPHVLKSIESLDQSVQLADQGLNNTSVDILIGAKYADRLTTGEKKFIDNLCLENSEFGWLTQGPVHVNRTDLRCCSLAVSVQDTLAQFWEVEEVTPPKITLNKHELCEKYFSSTRTQLQDGRFQIRLPIRSASEKLANTYQQARNGLLKFEKADEPIRLQYIDFMADYLERGHMRLADSLSVSCYFIPHLPVICEDSSTTKLRVVFNASAKNKSGVSLNKNLLNGPIHQPPLFKILVKFRKYNVAFSADIEKMYHQIKVHEDDRHFQSILWRFNVNEPVQIYELNTLTYGTGPAAYIATECLRECANDVPETQPEVAEAIKEEFWLDDLLSSDTTFEKAILKAQ